MNIRIKRFDKEIPLPKYQTPGAAGFDLAARERTEIAPHTLGYVPLGVAVEIPDDHFLLLAGRSSLPKRGVMMANGIGVLDSDFRGDEDEIKAVLYNFTETPVVIEKGDRILQGVLMPLVKATWSEVERMDNETRGGFGTTGIGL